MPSSLPWRWLHRYCSCCCNHPCHYISGACQSWHPGCWISIHGAPSFVQLYSTVVWYRKWTPVLPILSLVIVLVKTSTSSLVAAEICAAGHSCCLLSGDRVIWQNMGCHGLSKLFLIPSGSLLVLMLAIAACRPGSGH